MAYSNSLYLDKLAVEDMILDATYRAIFSQEDTKESPDVCGRDLWDPVPDRTENLPPER